VALGLVEFQARGLHSAVEIDLSKAR
jgi:hypothetical protein